MTQFTDFIHRQGEEHYRSMPWRDDTRPYYVLVSELMLQQTQVSRVIPKFEAFIKEFPDQRKLAQASLAEVLQQWQGLGYNRRAKFLHDSAKMIVSRYDDEFPNSYEQLCTLPGVGPNTAGAIMAYTYNHPVVFIETNIRTVYFHHFFSAHDTISDEQIRHLLELTIDRNHPREFYWALMDYGSWLKAHGVRNVSQSQAYKKQAKLEGSVRQMRGMIIRELTIQNCTISKLEAHFNGDKRFHAALAGLKRDGLVDQTNTQLHLTKSCKSTGKL